MGALSALGIPIRKNAQLIDALLSSVTFSLILFGGSAFHLSLIAAQNCHGDNGEASFFCSKAWERCRALKEKGTAVYVNDVLQCPIRNCKWPQFYDPAVCKPAMRPITDQSFFSHLLVLTNYWMRWIYTGLIIARMLSKGLILSEGAFFRDFYCVLDVLIMLSAWMNVYIPHGNLMFLMIVRGNQVTTKNTYPNLAPLRVIVNSIINGASEIGCLYTLISFFMGFFGLLAMSLIGSKGDFHNRCAIPLFSDDGNFTYEPIVPPVTCRMDHMYNPNQFKDCYGDVWDKDYQNFVPASRPPGVADPTGPGCRGTCSSNQFFMSKYLGTQINLTVLGRNNRFGSPVRGSEVYCIGPDLFPIDMATFPPTTQEGLPLRNYVSANLTNWPPILDIRGWDNIGAASISIYTIYFRSAWSDVFDATRASTSSLLFIVWVFIIMSITYYILNTSVGIICRNYSIALEQEAEAAEAREKAKKPPSLGDDDDEDDGGGDGDGDDDDDDDQDIEGMEAQGKTIQSKVMDEMKEYTDEVNPCGKGCDELPVLVPNITARVLESIGTFLAQRVKLLGLFCRPIIQGKSPWYWCKNQCHACVKGFCRCCLTIAIKLAIPNVGEEDFMAGKGHAPLQLFGLASSFGTIITLLMQQDTVNMYKCGCTASQISASKDLDSLTQCTAAGECSKGFSCIMSRCVEKANELPYACINPLWNSRIEALRVLTQNPELEQPTAIAWESARTQWCSFGMYLHFALYGWAVVLLTETVLNFLGHQGWTNYLTNKLYPEAEGPEKKKAKPLKILASIPGISVFVEYGVNVKNIVDAVANLATAAGIILTEISLGSIQTLGGRVSQDVPAGEAKWSSFLTTSTLPWVVKFLRMGVILRIMVRIPMLEKNSFCAAVIRGLRGIDRLLIGQLIILYCIFVFAMIGKELFDYGNSTLNGPFTSFADFHDLPSSLVPLLNIMASGSFYEYAKEATLVLGVPGFIYISFYYFIVNFQVLNIFIAIIVQNYVLKDDEKLEAQKAILRSNFEKTKILGKFSADYEKSFASFRKHYNELLVGAQLSLRSLMQFQRNIVKDDSPLNKELEDYLAGIDSSKDILAKVDREEQSEAEKVQQREAEVASKLSIHDNIFGMKQNKVESMDTEVGCWERVVLAIYNMLKSQAWNVIVGIFVIFSTAMAVVVNLPDAIDFLISAGLLAFFLIEAALKCIGFGLFGKWRSESQEVQEAGGIVFYMKGLITGKERRIVARGYLLRPWCNLELLIILVMLIDVYVSMLPKELQFTDPDLFKGLRSIRIIRLLSNLQRAKVPEEVVWKESSSGLKYPAIKYSDKNPVRTIMLALSASLPSILFLIMIAFGMLLIFSLVGMEQFSGMLSACSNDADLYGTATLCNHSDVDCFPGYPGQCQAGICLMNKQDCYGNKLVVPSTYDSVNWRSVKAENDFVFPQPRTWLVTRLNFDTAAHAFFATFCSISRSGVTFLMQSLGSITGRTTAPISGFSSSYYIYVILLNLVVGVFVCQVVIGIILTNLQLKSGYAFHTKEQLVWPATKNMFDRYFPDPKIYPVTTGNSEQSSGTSGSGKANPWMKVAVVIQDTMKRVLLSWKFNVLVTLTIFLNIGSLLSYSYDSDGDTYLQEFWIGFCCFLIYVFEAVVKIIAEPKRYFSNTSDQIDFALTVWNAMEIFLTPRAIGVEVSVASLRMFRLFNLLMKIEAMVQLVKMITGGIFEAFASGILLGFILFIFGCVGTRFFSFVKDGTVISPTRFGFTTLPESMISLFKLSSSTDTFLLDVITDSKVQTPKCSAINWIPYGVPGFTTPNPFGEWKNADMGYNSVTSDCGNSITAYIFYLFYIITCNYVVLPTYIAVVLNNVFEESVKSYSLVKEQELKLYVEAWVSTFGRKERVTFPVQKADEGDEDPKTKKKAKDRHNFDNFDNLLMALDMKGCCLYIDKNTAAYKLATTKFRDERGKTGKTGALKPCVVEYKELAAVLLSVTEKVRPITIVDKLRRKLAVTMLQEEGKRPPEPKLRTRDGQLHANVNFPGDKKDNIKKSGLELKDLIYSYNVYVVLDQLVRLQTDLGPITEDAHRGLKNLVSDDDEDLFVYFEEYVEKSGPDYSKEECWKCLKQFKEKAVDVYARSSYSKNKKTDESPQAAVDSADHEDGGVQEGVEQGENADEDVDSDEDEDIDGTYGNIVDDMNGEKLDLRDWMACHQCNEPIMKSWDNCPSCRAAILR